MPMAKVERAFLIVVLTIIVVVSLFFILPRLVVQKRAISPANREVIAQLPLTQARQSGDAMIAHLEGSAKIDGFHCAAGWVHFYESGRLKAFYLGKSTMIEGRQVPAGTWIKLNPDSTLNSCFFPEDTEIQGYMCKGGKLGPEGTATGFYSSGRLSFFYPRDDVEVGNVLCRATPFGGIALHENGSLRQCTLGRDHIINGRTLASGQVVFLDENGQLQSVSSSPWIERIRNWTRKIL